MAAEYRAALAANTHVSFSWKIVVSRPDDWQEPADPHSVNRPHPERFAEADYRTIALYRLGGLADVGALRPIVPKPKDTGDMVRNAVAYAAWRVRFPIDDDHWDQDQPPLSIRALPPDVAEQLLDDVETWAKGEAATRGESQAASGLSVPPGDPAHAASTGPTMGDLASEVGISDDTFRRVREAAKIVVRAKGAAARKRRYTPGEVDRLIAAALAGGFLERKAMSQKWAKWATKPAR